MSELWTPENDSDFAPAKAIKPASQWRNKWGAAEFCLSVDMATGRTDAFGPGDVVWGTKLFPTKEVAEEYAQVAIEMDVSRGVSPLEYLGAHAVEGDA